MSQAILELQNITKTLGGNRVLDDLSLSVEKGEFLTILGSSGCGKTTTLRVIAGLADPDSGRVFLSGRDVTALPPEKRNVNTVFQNYALFPHLSVEKNIAYGLKMRGESREVQKKAVEELLALVALEGYEKRMPAQLSGGQRQRVAIARAVALKPDVLLLDEPLGALDLKLRRQMQSELKQLQQRLGISFVYITHDQDEALNMSDHIAVMNNGRFEQIGTPEDIYEQPKTCFVARFIGNTTLFKGVIAERQGDVCRVDTKNGSMLATLYGAAAAGENVAVSVHAERIILGKTPQPGFSVSAVLKEKRYTGSLLRIELALNDGTPLTVHAMGALSALPEAGATVYPCWQADHAAVIVGEES